MSAVNQFEDDILDLLFTNIAAPNIGDASGLQPSAAAGSFNVALHTAQPAETATTQATSKAAYTGYADQTVARSVAGWTVASGLVDNDAAISYPQCTAGSETETHFSLGFTGSDYLQMVGALTASLAVSNGIAPQFAAGALDVSFD